MFEGKRGLRIAIYVKGFSEKEKRLFPDKDQMKICKEFIQSQTKGVLVKEYYDNYTKGGCLPMFNQMIEDGEYSCAGVPLFRRNGYRQSGGRKPLFRNRDTALT